MGRDAQVRPKRPLAAAKLQPQLSSPALRSIHGHHIVLDPSDLYRPPVFSFSLSLSLSLSLSRPHLVNNEECVLHHGCACSLESTECVTELRPKYLYKRFWGAPPRASGFSRNSRHPRLGRFGEFEMVLDTTRGGEEELRAPRRSVQNPGQLANPHVLACPPRESIFFAPWYWGLSARGRAVPPRWARGVSFVVLLST